jgi:hypothetical protein
MSAWLNLAATISALVGFLSSPDAVMLTVK